MNINSSYRSFALVLLILFSFQKARSQVLPGGEVEVIKSFDARLMETSKIDVAPEMPPLDTLAKLQTYSAIQKTPETEYLPPSIRPMAMPRDELAKVYNGFLKGGVGLPNTFYGEGSYYFNAIENLDFGINGRLFSANNSKKIENQRFNEAEFGVDGTYYFDQGFAINGKLNYSRNGVFFYGYNDINEELDSTRAPISFSPDEVKQRFSILDISASVFNGERTEADFNYSAGIDLYMLRDYFSGRENGMKLTLEATKWFDNSNPLDVKLITDFTSFRSAERENLDNFYLQPSYTFHSGGFKVKVGANVVSSQDKFFLYPDVEAHLNIIEGLVTAYAGAAGDLQKNTFRTLTNYNPFLVSEIDLKNTSYYNFYGGIKGNFLGIDYNAQLGYKSAKDLALFVVNDQMDSIVRFAPVYDTVNIFLFKASVSAPLFQGLELTGSISQSFFDTKREEKAWHLPTLSANVTARYTTPEQNMRFSGELYIENGVPYKASDGSAGHLNALLDLSLGGEYFFSENFGGFVQVNNVLNNRRQRWRHYPTFGLNAVVGLSVRF